jgi:hypothetical protein
LPGLHDPVVWTHPAGCRPSLQVLALIISNMTRAVISCDWTTNSTQCSKIARKNRETVLTWLRLIEARNEPLPERGDEYVLTAVALGSAERRQKLWLASMRLDYCSVKQASKLTTVQCPRLDTDHPLCASVFRSPGRHHSRPSVMWKYAQISRDSRWLGSSTELVLV